MTPIKSAVCLRVGGSAVTAPPAQRRDRLETPLGRVEYCLQGEGKPALVIHGVVGGWDGASSWRAFVPPGYRTTTPALFGYLGSTMPEEATPALQADAFQHQRHRSRTLDL